MEQEKNAAIKVSVIMPVYNSARTIARAIDSVLIQDVPLELLVLDDCSKDELDQVMVRYQDNMQIQYLHNEKNLGAAATRNRGVTLARGEYVAFLDSDDWWAEGKLKAQLELLEQTGAVLCSTARELANQQGQLTGQVIEVRKKITYHSLLTHNCINCSSVVMKTEVAREFPMEHEDSHEDYITWLRILRKYRQAVGINEPYLKYRVSTGGKSGSKRKSAAMTYQVYRYVGFGRIISAALFCMYAVNGTVKYSKAFLKRKS